MKDKNLEKLKEQIKKLPEKPGVYFFRGSRKEILYIGKATTLRSRVRSYFSRDLMNTRGPKLVRMIQLARSITFEETDSVLEALVYEAYLIKKNQPKYNSQEKDNKSYNYVVITKEDFPRVLIVRQREIDLGKITFKIKESFGPFTQGKNLRNALDMIRKIFPFRDKCKIDSKRGCFNKQIGLCPGVCDGAIDKNEYARNIRHISLFFKGKKKAVLKDLEKQMKSLAKEQEFEKAQGIKRQIFALEHINDVALISDDFLSKTNTTKQRIEGYDISHFGGEGVVGVMTVIEDGEPNKNEYRKFNIKRGTGNNDVAALKEILERRFGHTEWQYPDLLVIDGAEAQKNVTQAIVKKLGLNIPVISVKKDLKHKPQEILSDTKISKETEKLALLVNSESHRFAISFQRKKRKISLD
jgi:excinuclease ABC subunit C